MTAPSTENIMSSRAELRRLRLLEAEQEQQREELEALKITEEQLLTLRQPFMNVKFEFFDLDGLYNPKHSFYTRQYRAPAAWRPLPSATSPPTPAILTKADLARFSNDDTIRIPGKPRYTSVVPTENIFGPIGHSPTSHTKSRLSTPAPSASSPMRELDLNLHARQFDEYKALDGSDYHSPDIPYEDMLQDNTASPCPTPTQTFRCLPAL